MTFERACALAVLFIFLYSGCAIDSPLQHKKPAEFSGEVFSALQQPVSQAIVEINGQRTKTQENGRFQIRVGRSDTYLLSIRKTGFGLLSQSYDSGIQGRRWILTPATVKEVNPSRPIHVTDELSERACQGTLSSQSAPPMLPWWGGSRPNCEQS